VNLLHIGQETRELLEKQQYRFVGKHSACKICHWTKESLTSGRICFKEKWYGISSHRCLQCTVNLFCFNRCRYCWRSFKPPVKKNISKILSDESSQIIDGLIEQQRKLLSGFGGNPKADSKKWKEAQNPNNVALSLIGESIVYPKISELLEEFHKRKFTSFLVTKGTYPEGIKSLAVEPTNFYISLCAPDKETFKKIDVPLIPNAWEKQMESLELMNSLSCRKVIRITLVKGWNMKNPKGYAKLISKSDPDFIEPKAYFHVGESQKRLPRESMPTMSDVRQFSQEISKHIGYRIRDEDTVSRVVLLSRV